MRTVIVAGVASVVGFVHYCQPDPKPKTVVKTVEVPVDVIKYVSVPEIVEVVKYVDRPVLVAPNVISRVPSTDWDLEMVKGVKFFEGFKGDRYNCVAGVATIGYGCTDKSIVSKGSVSKSLATKVLLQDLEQVRDNVRQAVTVDLNEHQLNALTSFTFNCGLTNLKRLINGDDRLNNGNYQSVEKYLPMYRMAAGKPRKGLEKRRAWELSLWKGTPTL